MHRSLVPGSLAVQASTTMVSLEYPSRTSGDSNPETSDLNLDPKVGITLEKEV